MPPIMPKGNVDLPLVGTTSKKNLAIYAIVAGGVVGVAIWRRRRAATVSDTGESDETTAVDPSTGYDTGDTASVGGAGGYTGTYFGSGNTGSGALEETDDTTTTVTIGNNAQWSQAAVDRLSSAGLDSTTVISALGKYLQGSSVNDEENSVIQQAIAVTGQPPQSGTNGFPPSIRHVAAAPARPRLQAPILSVRRASTPNRSQLTWSAVTNAKYYIVCYPDGRQAQVSSRSATIDQGTKPQRMYVVASNRDNGYPDSLHSNFVNVPARPVAKKSAPKKTARQEEVR